ncbi:Glyoxal_oxid_N domain-containing protein/DUF1929 domain-containing protein [Cephalotus follicularis]|uniref:Glyoxal_oxid_N domain-containing protein/DUF1929 domain-containing protein n=1 Tax=Cephalotus follicularis TaxID=3775 RepID=A0A1Q3CRQ4_CEPFO|nr:Glyoxal_oxid_N domain-containing protein/DUF1929 domain-containing protein [Cephalotus follicularis]
MHMQLLNNDRVIIYDFTYFGKSNLSLTQGKCVPKESKFGEILAWTRFSTDCSAHSAEYNVLSNSVRALLVQTDVWCSSGSLIADGTLVQTGGYNEGERRVRIFKPCNNGSCDWLEIKNGLAARRWYATDHILPDGRQIIIGGRGQFNYEFYPKDVAPNLYGFPFLQQTYDARIENNLYPFVHLNVDGNLFIFANNQSILFDYANNKVVKTYPIMPGGEPRNYPSTGSSVLLPLKNLQAASCEAEVMVCGGAPTGSYVQARYKGNFLGALDTCGRIKITDPNPQWIMERMPLARVMGDMKLLPNGNVLIINGAAAGTAGWTLGRNPVLNPVLYRPNNSIGSRFETQSASVRPRMYHSSAIVLRDGRVLVGGSNPNQFYNFTGVLFPSDLSLEAFNPSYLDTSVSILRPKIALARSIANLVYAQRFVVRFLVTGTLAQNMVTVTMLSPAFTTHSFSMNQRLLVLGGDNVKYVRKSMYEVEVIAPSSKNVAPSGYYMLFIVHQEIPSEGIWVRLQ